MKHKHKREPLAHLIYSALHAARNARHILETAEDSDDTNEALDAIRGAIGQLSHIRNRVADQKAEK